MIESKLEAVTRAHNRLVAKQEQLNRCQRAKDNRRLLSDDNRLNVHVPGETLCLYLPACAVMMVVHNLTDHYEHMVADAKAELTKALEAAGEEVLHGTE